MTARTLLMWLGAAVLGVGVPWFTMRMLGPSLAASPAARVTNFRGRAVYHGLGIVWLVWACCAVFGGVLGAGASSLVAPALTLAGPLALVAFAFGVVDDAYGTGDSRGFRGHVTAMMKGRLTTGGLKLLGIGTASLFAAFALSSVAAWGTDAADALRSFPDWVGRGIGTLVAGASIALTSNLVNLMDLRPGRALKFYGVLAAFALVSFAALAASAGGTGGAAPLTIAARELPALALFLIGPVMAVWRDDLGERGMLGDAGANPMGAVTGMLIVMGLPLAGLLVYFALVLALNLVSERVSFSAVIDGNAVLSRLDGIGRAKDPQADSAMSSESVAHDDAPHV